MAPCHSWENYLAQGGDGRDKVWRPGPGSGSQSSASARAALQGDLGTKCAVPGSQVAENFSHCLSSMAIPKWEMHSLYLLAIWKLSGIVSGFLHGSLSSFCTMDICCAFLAWAVTLENSEFQGRFASLLFDCLQVWKKKAKEHWQWLTRTGCLA